MTLAVIALAALVGLIAVLKVVAPKTQTTLDDKALDLAEEVEPIVEGLAGSKADQPASK